MDTAEMQLAILNLLMDELPLCNRLLLGWLLNHMSHIAEKVRMGEGEEKGTEDSRREEGTKESGRERNEKGGKEDNREWEGEREQSKLKFLVLFHDRLILTRWVYQI